MAKPTSSKRSKPTGARAAAPADAPQTAVAPEPTDHRVAWTSLYPTLAKVDPKASSPLRGNLQLAALAASRVAAYVTRPEVRARFAKLAEINFFDMAHLDGLAVAARAALYASHRYKLTLGAHSEAKLPAELDASSGELRNRMFSVAEHNLGDDSEIARRINVIRPGTGYLDRANDLVGLADIYHDRPDAVRLDGKHFRASDEADARATAAKIFEALGLGSVVEGVNWYEAQHLAWVHLDTLYRSVARWGRALSDDDAHEALFPDLRGASRAPWGSVSRGTTEDPPKPPTG